MTQDFSIQQAVVYDIESFPNVFTLDAQALFGDFSSVWEISEFRDDRHHLMTWFNHLHQCQIPMIGFNNLFYDYTLIHWIYKNPQASAYEIYLQSKKLINSKERFGNTIWPNERFAPQIDLFKIYHFDNKAKTTNLKALQINMRSDNVMESAAKFDTVIPKWQIDQDVIPYNRHDTQETKKFALLSLNAIEFRVSMIPQFSLEVLNWNDTKIGENILIDKIGRDVCMPRGSDGKRHKRQTIRTQVALSDIIFPYVQFQNPEFQRVLSYLKGRVLKPEEFITDEGEFQLGDTIKTKGVFKGLVAHVGNIDFYYGTGGLHASVPTQHVRSGNGYVIRDIDVASLYPSIAIKNRLYPAHLGEAFIAAYASLPAERKVWQKKKGKKCNEANSLKLGGNGAYGKSNDKFSCLFDPQFTMTITVNGQLLLSMLAEWLLSVPTLSIIQVNTDGITYRIKEEYLSQAIELEDKWQKYTLLELESVDYSDMWIRDVNSYIAKPVGSNVLKQKGAYWHPESGERYAASISEQQPPAWHKDLGNLVSIKAAVAQMVDGIGIEDYINFHADPFDFMLRIKVGRDDRLMLGQREMQRNTRYYVARDGERMVKIAHPPKGATVGHYCRANKISDAIFAQVMAELQAKGTPLAWDARIHTKNQSTYKMRETNIQSGWLIAECNHVQNFDWNRLDRNFYIQEAKKLLIT